MTVSPTCDPIGTAHTPFSVREDAPRQGIEAGATGELELDPAYEPGLADMEPGDDVLVIWFADHADRSVLEIDHGSPRGVFTSRSPDRPNPICITRCELLAVEGSRLRVRGVDMLDGSPILDLKPPLDG